MVPGEADGLRVLDVLGLNQLGFSVFSTRAMGWKIQTTLTLPHSTKMLAIWRLQSPHQHFVILQNRSREDILKQDS